MIKPFYIFLFLICFCCETKSQTNLVPNGSFEDYTTCPTYVAQVNYATHWFDPTNTSSDYYNACCSNIFASIPATAYGYKNAYDGNGIMGFATYTGGNPANAREYIAVTLKEPLDSNKHYCFSCYISACGNYKFLSNGIGFCLLQDTVGIYNYYYNTLPYPTSYINNDIISDTSGWQKIEVDFLNNQKNARYLVLGNFYNDNNIHFNIIDSTRSWVAYYYIDKVELFDCEELTIQIPNVVTANKDGVNDVFNIKNLPPNAELTIYNRWGVSIYNTNNYQNNWQANDENAGTYYYLLRIKEKIYKGFITVFK